MWCGFGGGSVFFLVVLLFGRVGCFFIISDNVVLVIMCVLIGVVMNRNMVISSLCGCGFLLRKMW